VFFSLADAIPTVRRINNSNAAMQPELPDAGQAGIGKRGFLNYSLVVLVISAMT